MAEQLEPRGGKLWLDGSRNWGISEIVLVNEKNIDTLETIGKKNIYIYNIHIIYIIYIIIKIKVPGFELKIDQDKGHSAAPMLCQLNKGHHVPCAFSLR